MARGKTSRSPESDQHAGMRIADAAGEDAFQDAAAAVRAEDAPRVHLLHARFYQKPLLRPYLSRSVEAASIWWPFARRSFA